MGDQSKANEIEERLINVGVGVMRLSRLLPQDYAGQHIANQLLRSGTSPAPNYAEARGAESRADFLHKLRIVLKKLNETRIWIRIIEKDGSIPTDRLMRLAEEVGELSRIIQASVETTRKTWNRKRKKSDEDQSNEK